MKVKKANRKRDKSNGFSQLKVEICNSSIENYQYAKMRILRFAFESQFLKSIELLNSRKH